MCSSDLRFDGSPARIHREPPLLGQHNDELLAELGFDEDEVDALKSRGAFGAAEKP